MKKLLTYLPLHFTLAVIAGILLQFYENLWQFDVAILLFCNIAFLVVLLLLHQKNKRILFSITTWLFFVFVGISSVFIQDKQNDTQFYTSFLTKNTTAVVTVDNVLKPGNYYDKYLVEVSQINQNKTVGSVLLNLQKDSLQTPLQVDDRLFLKPVFKSLIAPLNPHQFNYQNYLAKKGIHHQIFLDHQQYKQVGKRAFSLLGIASKIRIKIQNSLHKYAFSKDEYAIVNALLLGQRQDISKELIRNYAKAGAIHILAVSGLHVGILLLILTVLFRPLEQLKNGKLIKMILIILLLWMFAFIAGLSASVVRAVTMFSFVAIGSYFGKKQTVFYALIASLFFLLLFNPMFLFDVGFQLSYLAVFGIVWVQPKLYALWKPSFFIFDKLWQLFTVSIAAQVGILPLSLYYFHQFPGLFILSNLVIIPFLGIILIGGILVIILAVLNVLPTFLVKIYVGIIEVMNHFVSWISKQEQFLFTQISFSFLMMVAWYLVIFLGVSFIIQRKMKPLIYLLVSVVLLQGVYVFEKYKNQHKKEFLVFHKSRKIMLGDRIGSCIKIYHNLDSLQMASNKIVQAYQIGEQVSIVTKKEIPAIFNVKNNVVLRIDSLGIYQLKGMKKPIVLLQFSPKLNLQRLIDKLHPEQIIADGSNYKTTINLWKRTCVKNNTPFYYTGQNGAIVLQK